MEYKKHILEFAKGTLVVIAGGAIGLIAYNGLWSNTIEKVTVKEVGFTEVYFYHVGGWANVAQTPMIKVDTFDTCLRGYEIIDKNITPGERLQSVSYRSPLFGECKVLTEIVREN